ncbi:hypothetical protein ACFLQ7_03760 [Actinomycetota bacterium]
MRNAFLWGNSKKFNATSLASYRSHARQRLAGASRNAIVIDAYQLGEDDLASAARRIVRFKPKYLHGYASAVARMAEYLDAADLLPLPWQPLAVFTESEPLLPSQRHTISRAFACPVSEQYGSVEIGHIATQHPDGIMRVDDDHVVLERATDGELLVTALRSHAFPIIRYRQGDVVDVLTDATSPSSASPYSTVEGIRGRIVDRFVRPGGGTVHGVAVAHCIDPHAAYIAQYQVVQKSADIVVVGLVPRTTIPKDVERTIERDLLRLLGDDVQIAIERQAEIKPDPSGKYRWVRSDVADHR